MMVMAARPRLSTLQRQNGRSMNVFSLQKKRKFPNKRCVYLQMPVHETNEECCNKIFAMAGVVAQLAELSPPTPEICGSNPVTGKL